MKIWMLTITGRKKYWGNEQYGNDPIRSYSYDSLVQNHKALAINDIIIIREGERLTGLSTIDQIHQKAGYKELNECPVCRSNRVRFRRTIKPHWKCAYGHQFDAPEKAVRNVVVYDAKFEEQYRELTPNIDWRRLRSHFSNKSALSIRNVSLQSLLKSNDIELRPLQLILRRLLDENPANSGGQKDPKSAIYNAKNALGELVDFLEGCRASDDTDPRNGNKLELPIDTVQLTALWSEIEVIRDQLDKPEAVLQNSKEPSFVMQQTKNFLSEFIKGAGKTAGALAAAGIAAKLFGLLDAIILALKMLTP